ncbi:MAG: hypothetical protein K9L75_00430 [Spirochaetia bacterium]|nr:hypothetical protein [Spirochaetia bacterium]
MKKFLLILLFLVIIAGIVFYIAWIQLRIDRDQIAVVHTKTVGYLDEPVVSGEFYWTGWKLIPKNTTIIKIPFTPQYTHTQISGILPSGEVFSHFLPGSPDFNYDSDIGVYYRISKEHVIEVVKEQNITEKNFSTWLEHKNTQIEDRVNRLFLEIIEQGLLTNSQNTSEDHENSSELSIIQDYNEISSYLKEKLYQEFDFIKIESVQVNSLKLPDLSLYQKAKTNYNTMLTKQQASLETALNELADMRAKDELTIQKLENYGELFTRFPILLDFLEMNGFDSLP